jgi:NADH-quinone oxidoreductase subunit A
LRHFSGFSAKGSAREPAGDTVTDSLVPILMIIGVAAIVAAGMLVLGYMLGRPKRSAVDGTPYECGATPYVEARRHRFSVHFYLVAMLFILFDIEAAFLIPWAVTFRDFAFNRMFVLGEMAVFLGILIIGFVYLWKRGALEWE